MQEPAEAVSRDAVVVARGIGRRFGYIDAVRDLDLGVRPGTCVALIGHNGSGKTTTLELLAGRLRTTSGSLEVAGELISGAYSVERLRARIAYVPDEPVFYADLTTSDHLRLVAIAHGVAEIEVRVDEALRLWGLADRSDSLPDELSSGMRQKLNLACALIRPFSLLLLDEPARALDGIARARLWDLLRVAKSAAGAIVLSTHSAAIPDGLVDDAVLLHEGVVAASGGWDEVLATEMARALQIADA